MDFYLSAYKPLRSHKDMLMDLVESKKWKTTLLSLTPETFQNSGDPGILSEMIYQLISGKLKRTAKEKRTGQIASRKFIVRTMFQFGTERGLEFLHFFRKNELGGRERILSGPTNILEKKLTMKKLDITFDVFLMAAKNASCSKDIFNDILDILLRQGNLVKIEIEEANRE